MPIYKNSFLHPGSISGRKYPLSPGPSSSGAAVSAIDTIYFFPFELPFTLNFTGFSVWIVTGGAASSMKAGIWANSPISMKPLGAPLYVDNTGVATTASGAVASIATGSGILAGGVCYWAGAKFTGTPPTLFALTSTNTVPTQVSGFTNATYSSPFYAFADTYSNSMPTIAEGSGGFSNTSSNIPLIYGNT